MASEENTPYRPAGSAPQFTDPSTGETQSVGFTPTPLQKAYPDRFYALYDPTAEQPTPVKGWYDMANFSSPDNLPPLTELLPLTPDFWEAHLASSQNPSSEPTIPAVQDGKIVYLPVPKPSLKDTAQAALSSIMSQAPQLTVMGEVFGPNTQAYVKKLRAIINGTDTTTTTLPTVPTDLTT